MNKKLKHVIYWIVLLILTFFLAVDIAYAMMIPIILFWILFLFSMILIALDIKYILAPYSTSNSDLY